MLRSGKIIVDDSNKSLGYISAAVNTVTKKKLKLRIICGGTVFIFDIRGDGKYETYPLQKGSGTYLIYLYENTAGKTYAQKGAVAVFATIKNPNECYKHPNQYVNYSENSPVVEMAKLLREGRSDILFFYSVRGYISSNFAYDFIKATQRRDGMLPDIDGCFKKKMGICQDLAAIAVAMFRSVDIPAKLMIGYADKQYHAWANVLIGGEWKLLDPTSDISAISKVKKYTTERWY